MTHTPATTIGDTDELLLMNTTELTEPSAPTRALIAPWGGVESANGSFVVDEEAAGLVIAAFERHGTDLPIDYEHQTLGGAYASPTGQAPAAGWIRRLVARPGVGLFAEIDWTPHAKQMLAGREYRYLSPVAIIRKSDRKLTAIHSVALTNKPAIVGMTPLVNRAGVHRSAKAGEPETPLSDRPDRQNSAADCTADAMTQLCQQLDLPADTGEQEILVAARDRLLTLTQQSRAERIRGRVAEAMRAGKLVEAQRDWAETLLAKDERLFNQWLATAPVVVRTGRLEPPDDATSHSQLDRTAAARARAEFRASPFLMSLTTEEAYTADALRAAGK